MKFRFDAQISAPKGKLSREDKTEIRDYILSQSIEAPDAEKAVKALIKKLQGKQAKSAADGSSTFILSDYGPDCKVKVKPHEEA